MQSSTRYSEIMYTSSISVLNVLYVVEISNLHPSSWFFEMCMPSPIRILKPQGLIACKISFLIDQPSRWMVLHESNIVHDREVVERATET